MSELKATNNRLLWELCYVDPHSERLLQLFFVPSLKDATGSDWRRGYYESHSSYPDGESTQIVVWNQLGDHWAPLVGPGGPYYRAEGCPLSVNAINKGAAAWLTYQSDDVVETFKGGDTLEDCLGRLKKLGFTVYREI